MQTLNNEQANSAELNGLINTVITARGAFTAAVQAATIQSIAHFLVYGDTSYMTRLYATFNKGTLGGRSFTMYCEQFGGVELAGKTNTKEARFIKCDETFAALPITNEVGEVSIDLVIAYMATLPTDWSATKAPKSEEDVFDLDAAIVALLKKAKAKEEKSTASTKVLLAMLEGTVAKFHSDSVVSEATVEVEAEAA